MEALAQIWHLVCTNIIGMEVESGKFEDDSELNAMMNRGISGKRRLEMRSLDCNKAAMRSLGINEYRTVTA